MADEPKPTRSSAKKDSAQDEFVIDPELSQPVVASSVIYPTPPPEAPDDAEEQERPVVTFKGKEIELDPDLEGRIVSFVAATAFMDHPAHTDPEWSNPAFAPAEG